MTALRTFRHLPLLLALAVAPVSGPAVAGARAVQLGLPGTALVDPDTAFAFPVGPLPDLFDDPGVETGRAGTRDLPAMATRSAIAGKADAIVVNVEFVLAQLAIQLGGDSHARLHRLMPKQTRKAIFIRGGSISLDELAERLATAHPGAFSRSGRLVRANWPIVVWTDAALFVEPGDALEFAAGTGAFIYNLGLMSVDGASIRGPKADPAGTTTLRPFIVTAATGAIQIRKAAISDLGLANGTQKDGQTDGQTGGQLGGLSILGGALFPSRQPSFIIDTRLARTGTLTVRNSRGFVFSGNRLSVDRPPAMMLSGTTGARLDNNIVTSRATGTAILIRNAARAIKVVRNGLFFDAGSALSVTGASRDILVAGNLVSGSRSEAITVNGGRCIDIRDNVVSAGQKGAIRIRASRDVTIRDNRLAGNAGPAISLVGPFADKAVIVSGNLFEANQSAIKGNRIGKMVLEGNDFKRQLPIVLAGELGVAMPAILARFPDLDRISLTLDAGRIVDDGPAGVRQTAADPSCNPDGDK